MSGSIEVRDPGEVFNPYWKSLDETLRAEGIKQVELDLSELDFMNSSGILTLVRWIILVEVAPGLHDPRSPRPEPHLAEDQRAGACQARPYSGSTGHAVIGSHTMTEHLLCAGCRSRFRPDDRFCSQCGRPNPTNRS